jgi:hypothetical protein
MKLIACLFAVSMSSDPIHYKKRLLNTWREEERQRAAQSPPRDARMTTSSRFTCGIGVDPDPQVIHLPTGAEVSREDLRNLEWNDRPVHRKSANDRIVRNILEEHPDWTGSVVYAEAKRKFGKAFTLVEGSVHLSVTFWRQEQKVLHRIKSEGCPGQSSRPRFNEILIQVVQELLPRRCDEYDITSEALFRLRCNQFDHSASQVRNNIKNMIIKLSK